MSSIQSTTVVESTHTHIVARSQSDRANGAKRYICAENFRKREKIKNKTH